MNAFFQTPFETRRLCFLFQLMSGATPSSQTAEYWDGDINWVTPEDLGKLDGRTVYETRRRITAKGYQSCAAWLAPPRSVILSKRAPIGQVAILGASSTCNQGCFLLIPNENIDERFYYYCLLRLRPTLEALGRGSTFAELSLDDLRSVRLPYPPIETQRRIADYLDRETGRIDALIAAKERLLALLAEKRAVLISQLVTRGLDPSVPTKPSGLEWVGEIPKHWEVCQLKRTWKSSEYGISESIREEGEIPILRMNCIENGRVNPAKAGMVNEVDPSLFVKLDDLLFNRTNSLDQIAKVGLVDFSPSFPLSFASYLVRIRTNHNATPQYLTLLLNASIFLEFARKNAIPAIGQANLSPTRYGEIHIPLPPLEEQQAIVEVTSMAQKRDSVLRGALERSITLARERRAALISAAVCGQIPL